MSRAFRISGQISFAPGTFQLRSFLASSQTSARDMVGAPPSLLHCSTKDLLVRFRTLSKCFFPLPDNIPYQGQLFSSPAENTLIQALLYICELSSGKPELPYGQVKIHLHSLSKLLPDTGIRFGDRQNCSPSGLLVPVCCLRRPLGQPSLQTNHNKLQIST